MCFQLEIRDGDSTPRQLVVCFSRMFAYEKWQTAIAAIELYMLHGADLMIVPIASVIHDLFLVLRAYEESGANIRMQPAVRISSFVSEQIENF